MDIERLKGAEYLPRTWGMMVLRENPRQNLPERSVGMSANGMMRKLAESLRKSGRVKSVHGSVILGLILLDVEDDDGGYYQFIGKAVPAPRQASEGIPVPWAELPHRGRVGGGHLSNSGPWSE